MQLDLLSYQLTPEELASPIDPQPLIRSQLNRGAIEWLDAKQFYYLRLIGKFVEIGIQEKASGNADPVRQARRRHEIARLHQIRSDVLRQIEELEGGEGD